MSRIRNLIFCVAVLMSVTYIGGVSKAYAQSQTTTIKENVIKRNQKKYISQAQRKAAANRLKQASPQAAAKIAQIRSTLARAAADRVATCSDENNVLDEKQSKEIRKAALRVAEAGNNGGANE